MATLATSGAIPRRVALRQCKHLNNVIEQDRRTVKKRVWLAKGYGSFQTAWRTLQGIETVHMIRKGRVSWLGKGDVIGQARSSTICSDSPSLSQQRESSNHLTRVSQLVFRTSQRNFKSHGIRTSLADGGPKHRQSCKLLKTFFKCQEREVAPIPRLSV